MSSLRLRMRTECTGFAEELVQLAGRVRSTATVVAPAEVGCLAVFADDYFLPWFDRLREEVGELALFDVHTHIGADDPDGYSCTPERLQEGLGMVGGRGVVFAMHEPGGYPPANDRVLAAADASEGRLVPFCRVDPRRDAVKEAERCLAAGARGIKLHPRAEDFTLDIPPVRDLFALADEHELPIMCHAGRGIPALGHDAVELCGAYPRARLILAHAGISDLGWIWRRASDHPNLFFDTSWWMPADLLALFSLVPPGQILFGSDAPYGTPMFTATACLRYMLQAGLDRDQIRSVAGEQTERLVSGEEPRDLGAAPAQGQISGDVLLDRVYGFLLTAIGQMFAGVEPAELLSLVRLACEVGDEAPQAPVCRSVLTLLEEREDYVPEEAGRPQRFAPGLHFVVLAACLTRTPAAPLPQDALAVDVGARERA
jgi:hypothetical protein